MLQSWKDVVTINTDQQNLIYFDIRKVLKFRQVCLISSLAKFDFKVVYNAGYLNTKVNVLLRHWDNEHGERGNEIAPVEISLFKPGQLIMSFTNTGINTFLTC